jgi:KDO2-lipid IV(A) lauroyltransferase
VSRLAFALMWVARLLPAPLLAAAGNAVGLVMYWLVRERREVTRINLEKCFPDLDAARRETLARRHFRAFCRSFVERGLLWWSSRGRIERLVRIEGREHLEALQGRPAVVFAPHFVGLDAALARLSLEFPLAVTYSHQKDPLFDRLLLAGRSRFGARLFARNEAGLLKALRIMKKGRAFLYYLPDLDFGRERAVFVPFFGVPAATVTGLSYIAKLTGAAVVPCVTRMLPGGGYVAKLYAPWTGFPSGDDERDARRMMAFIEERVLEMPEQYFWLHKRFKTRPEGAPRFY